ncbi:dTDP-4-dehydrorhamnose reductase [Caldicellulosiruptor changbaiensis]|uniref:dTDP-4-dehydrorhamnose reductase n=1 Tax=Caldicellulosiruptor changbaiensis TaxID=1222016 RepID=UPI0019D106D0|nr:dTDP-4-dehydrorhamnose reductase [Caldicellulosiruptor changbaiensis]
MAENEKGEKKAVKVLITGAAGQLGQAFQRFFTKRGIDYIAADHSMLDITNLSQLREFVKGKDVTHIINCAAYNAVDKAEEDWKTAYLVNGLGVRNLAIISLENKIELVHYSTDYVFDGKKSTPYTIFDTPSPLNKYGESKLLGERFITLTEYYYLIRVSWVFGIGNTNFLKRVFDWSKERHILKIADDEISAPTYTDDLVYATYLLLKERAFGLYHITNTPASRFEWVEYVLRKVGWKGKIERAKKDDFKLPAKRPGYSVLDNFGLKETVNFEMPTWQDATDRYLRQINLI